MAMEVWRLGRAGSSTTGYVPMAVTWPADYVDFARVQRIADVRCFKDVQELQSCMPASSLISWLPNNPF
eukprot:1670292-Amphidinium_carterae.2